MLNSNKSEIINKILFDYESLSREQLLKLCDDLSNKDLRWLAANHMDNRTRIVFFKLSNVTIGEGTVINQNVIVSDDYKPLLIIGKRVAISPNVSIICSSAPNNSILAKNPYVQSELMLSSKIVIEDDAWIGAGTIILPGVTIGKKSIVGAGSLVSKDVQSNCIFKGVPAKFSKKLI
ncbi:MAG: acyltransferase [Flavobacteriaceae bacterium]